MTTNNYSTPILNPDLPPDDNKCPICLDRMVLPVTYECQHTFCFLCIKAVIEGNSQPTCPLCRVNLDKDTHVKIPESKLNEVPKERYYWQYQGRNFGWWNYERQMSNQIEETYRRFLWKQRTIELGEEEEEFDSISSDESEILIKDNCKKRTISKKNSISVNPAHCEMIIGSTIYVIDVEKSIQYDKNYPESRKREIRRVSELDQEETKGTAGIEKYYE